MIFSSSLDNLTGENINSWIESNLAPGVVLVVGIIRIEQNRGVPSLTMPSHSQSSSSLIETFLDP